MSKSVERRQALLEKMQKRIKTQPPIVTPTTEPVVEQPLPPAGVGAASPSSTRVVSPTSAARSDSGTVNSSPPATPDGTEFRNSILKRRVRKPDATRPQHVVSTPGVFLVPLGVSGPSSNPDGVIKYAVSIVGCSHPKGLYQAASSDAPSLEGLTQIQATEYGQRFPIVAPSNLLYCATCASVVSDLIEKSIPTGAVCPYYSLGDFVKTYKHCQLPEAITDEARLVTLGSNLFINLSHPDFRDEDPFTLTAAIREHALRRNFLVGWTLDGKWHNLTSQLARSFSGCAMDISCVSNPYLMDDAAINEYRSPVVGSHPDIPELSDSDSDLELEDDDEFSQAPLNVQISSVLADQDVMNLIVPPPPPMPGMGSDDNVTFADQAPIVPPSSFVDDPTGPSKMDSSSQTNEVFSSSKNENLPLRERSQNGVAANLLSNLALLKRDLSPFGPFNLTLVSIFNGLSLIRELSVSLSGGENSDILANDPVFTAFLDLIEHETVSLPLAFLCSNLSKTHLLSETESGYKITLLE